MLHYDLNGGAIIIGHETTAHTLAFFCYALAKYPEMQQRCLREVDRLPAESTVLPEYVEAALKESMRKYPVAARGSIRCASIILSLNTVCTQPLTIASITTECC